MSFPEPAPDGFGGHHPAVRRFDVTVIGDDTSDLSANVAALRRQCVRDKMLYFRPSTSGDLLSCRIREASVTEREVDMLDRIAFEAELTVTLTTDPYWLAPWGDEVDASGDITYVPGHIDIADPGGEVDALLSMRVVPAVEGTGLFVGVKPDPSGDYEYLDDYGASGAGSADANAYGGYKIASTGLDASLSEDVTAPTFDTGANRGRSLFIVRADTDATTPSDTTLSHRVTTTGSGIAASTSVDAKTPVAMSTGDLSGYEIETVTVPAGAVPDISTGAGWSTEGALYTQSDDSGSLSVSVARGADGTPSDLYFYQTWKATAEVMLTAFTFVVVTAPTTTTGWTLNVYEDGSYGGGDIAVATASVDSMASGSHKVSFSEFRTTTGSTYQFALIAPESAVPAADTLTVDSSTTSVYADGTAGESFDGDATVDLACIVHGKTALGFTTETAVLMACSEASRTVALDYVQRIPTDFAFIAYRLDSSGPLGLYFDASTDTPYVADADGIGPSVYEECSIGRPLRLKPGVTNRVVFGILQGDVAVAGMTALAYRVRKRYLSATG
jgi:hypothetical protein